MEWMNSVWNITKNQPITKVSKVCSLAIMIVFAIQSNAKDIKQYHTTSNNTAQSENFVHPIDSVLRSSDHINIIRHNNIITITINEIYTKQLGITGKYICNLIQDNNDKNYYILYSNIHTLWVNREELKAYCLSNGFEDIIDRIDNMPEDIAESILLMNTKDKQQNINTKDKQQSNILQQAYNYSANHVFDSCGEKDMSNKIVISDIPKIYNELNDAELFDKLNEALKDEKLSDIERQIIQQKLNKIAPYVFIDWDK